MEQNNNKMENNRYNNSKVYKLINTVDDTFYIGSTTTSLSKRLSFHKTSAKTKIKRNFKIYIHLNKIGFENIKIILINEFYLDNRDQLLRVENEYIEMYKNDPNCLNSIRAFSTDEQKKEQIKQYHQTHKDEIINYKKEYRQQNIEKIKEYDRNRCNKEERKIYNKKYRELNKERISDHQKQFYESNRELILENLKQKITCSCGSEIRRDGLREHEKSIKHKNYLHNLNEESQTI